MAELTLDELKVDDKDWSSPTAEGQRFNKAPKAQSTFGDLRRMGRKRSL